MNITRSPHISEQRFARLTAWAGLMLAWIGMMLFGAERPRPRRRLLRRRYRYLSLHPMARLIARFVVMRAAEMLNRRPARSDVRCDFAPDGFARRTRPRQLVRAAIGSRLRRALRHRDIAARFAVLAHALANLDALVAGFMRRARRGLTRLYPITLAAPPADAVRSSAPPPAACAADTS